MDSLTVIAGAAVALALVWYFVPIWLARRGDPARTTAEAEARSALSTGLAVPVALIAAAQAFHDYTQSRDKAFVEPYRSSLEAFANESPSVRLGAVHTLSLLVNERPDLARLLAIPVAQRIRAVGIAPETSELEALFQLASEIQSKTPEKFTFDLSGRGVARLGLAELNLRYSNFAYSQLPDADLRGSDLTGSDLYAANLFGADLTGALLDGNNLTSTDLRNARLDGARGRPATNEVARYLRTDKKVRVQGSRAALWDARLFRADFRCAHMPEAEFFHASMKGVRLGGADLYRARFDLADLRDANLRDANLAGASFAGADLRGADLGGANLSGITIDAGTQIDATTNLRGACGGIVLDVRELPSCRADYEPHESCGCPSQQELDG